jgi:hypothetical protein
VGSCRARTPRRFTGLDDDCDGSLDEGSSGTWVPVTGGFGTSDIFACEASRPDATSADASTMTHRACAAPNRQPWTNLTHADAEAACAAAGGRLRTEEEWQAACESSSGSCGWSYAWSCSTYQATRCKTSSGSVVSNRPLDEALNAAAQPATGPWQDHYGGIEATDAPYADEYESRPADRYTVELPASRTCVWSGYSSALGSVRRSRRRFERAPVYRARPDVGPTAEESRRMLFEWQRRERQRARP